MGRGLARCCPGSPLMSSGDWVGGGFGKARFEAISTFIGITLSCPIFASAALEGPTAFIEAIILSCMSCFHVRSTT